MARRAAAAPRKAATQPLVDCVVALSGKFDSIAHNHASLEKLVKALGGAFTRSVTHATTHLVCTEEEYNGSSSKVVQAKANSLALVSPQWILETEKQNCSVPIKSHEWGSSQPSDASAKKRPVSLSDDEVNGPGTKKSRRADRDAGIADCSSAQPGRPEVDSPVLTKEQQDLEKRRAEREIAKQDKKMSVGQFTKKNAVIPVDQECPLVNDQYAVFIEPDSGMIYDASLNQTHVSKNANKYYLIQTLVSKDSKVYKTWTRWGRVGETGQNAILGDGSLSDAIKHFEKKFKDKSGLAWNQRTAPPNPGKYAFVERSYNPDDDAQDDDEEPDKEEDKNHETSASTLAPAVQSLLELIFDPDLFKATMSAFNYNANKLPLGKLSKGNILRGYQQLKDLAALLDNSSLAQSQWGLSRSAAIEQLSNMYYSIIPHAFGRNKPPIINDPWTLKQEVDLLESLTDMKVADEIMKTLRPGRDVSLLDSRFASLGLDEMTVLDHKSTEFNALETYLCGSRGHTHRVNYRIRDIFRIERRGEKTRFDDYVQASKIGANRRLLWHGSRVTNFGGILSQGLRIAPPEAPAHGRWMDAGVLHPSLKGVQMPDVSEEPAHINTSTSLLYSEYICYNVAQVKLRYLFRVDVY
ncbi:Poly polymerase 2 [Escovopsis weberi]|uniref:Poly [ADP-ribose] polymerase n=1 Tax=Escovopsis weberi TaxID=150374 RepID=A0A0M9VRX7_ESCWE|nr:Poly polymerase 2 [Escovopsis weberi]